LGEKTSARHCSYTQQIHIHPNPTAKRHSYHIIAAYKPQNHTIVVEQAEKRSRQMDPSFPYLELARTGVQLQ